MLWMLRDCVLGVWDETRCDVYPGTKHDSAWLVLFIHLGWEKTKVFLFISIETEISKFCFKIVSFSSLESKNVKLRFDNSKINFIPEVEIEQAWPLAILKSLQNAA